MIQKGNPVPIISRRSFLAGASAVGAATAASTVAAARSAQARTASVPVVTVCDLEGRVLGQRGLYVLDGALTPGTTAACNPSMTIAAIAERALDQIVRNDVGTLF